jgi:hypothetical protein
VRSAHILFSLTLSSRLRTKVRWVDLVKFVNLTTSYRYRSSPLMRSWEPGTIPYPMRLIRRQLCHSDFFYRVNFILFFELVLVRDWFGSRFLSMPLYLVLNDFFGYSIPFFTNVALSLPFSIRCFRSFDRKKSCLTLPLFFLMFDFSLSSYLLNICFFVRSPISS